MRRLLLYALTGLTVAAAASAVRAQGPTQNPGTKMKPPERIAVLLPDLVVQQVALGKAGDGQTLSVRVTVANTCGAAAPQSYVLATFYDKAGDGAKALYYIGHEVKPLKGGETETQVLDLGAKKMPANAHVVVEVDPYKKVKEDEEGNNWMKLNPNEAPFPSNGQTHCKAKS
ncbi:MAG: CARDB domain-containing protein [Pyrinomonadaceae bacterium]